MKAVILTVLFPSLLWAFECKEQRSITIENDQKITLCEINKLQLSHQCAQDIKSCKLLIDLAQKPDPTKLNVALEITSEGTSGSRLCNLKGWTVLMGEMWDGSQVCTCKHPGGEFISCVSLDEYHRTP